MANAIVGSSLFSDDDFIALPFEAKAGFLLLQPWAATADDGRFGKSAAVRHLASMGAPDGIWDVLVASDMLRPDGKKWVLAGWDKYQSDERAGGVSDGQGARPTTRAGRILAKELKVLPDGWERQWDWQEELVESQRAGGVSGAWRPGGDPVPGAWHHGSDTPSPEVPPRPLSPQTPFTPTPPPTPTPSVYSPHERARGDNEFDPEKRDIRDTLYELTMIPPWGREWGNDALTAEAEYGFVDLDAAVRRAYVELSHTRKPWLLIKQADATLSRARALAKEAEIADARRARAARPTDAPTGLRPVIDPEEYEAKAKGYADV